MSRKKRKNKKSSESEDYEQPPFVCRCQKVYRKPFDKRNYADSKEKKKPVCLKWNSETEQETDDETRSYKSLKETQAKLLKSEQAVEERVPDPEKDAEGEKLTPNTNETENVQNVTATDNSSFSSENRTELTQNLCEQIKNGKSISAQMKSECVHLNFILNNRSSSISRTHIQVTSKKVLKKSRSYHDRLHQQSQNSANCRWDFASCKVSKNKMYSTTKRHKSERPFVTLEIIGEGIEVKCQTINNNLKVRIEADKASKPKDDIFQIASEQNTDYLSPDGSCNSYPVSDFSVYERKELSPEWYLDVPPPEEFADETGRFIQKIPEDEALLFEDSVIGSHSLPSISSCLWDLENCHDQAEDESCNAGNTEEPDKGLCLQYLNRCAQCSQKTNQTNKTRLNKFPFISNQELKFNTLGFSQRSKSDCCFDAKVVRRKTLPDMFYDPPRTYNNFRESFFDIEDQPFMSQVCPELFRPSNASLSIRQKHFPTIDISRALNSAPLLSHTEFPNEHTPAKLDYEKTVFQTIIEGDHCIGTPSAENQPDANVPRSNMTSEYPLHNVDTDEKSGDEEEDLEDLTNHAHEQIDFTESGFDEEMLDSDTHPDFPESRNKSFMIQITPPSRSTSKERFLDKKNCSRMPTDHSQDTELSNKEIQQTTATDVEIPIRKRSGSVVTVVTGDFDQMFLIQGDSQTVSDVIYSRTQRDLEKEPKQSYNIHRDSVLTPVSDVEEQELDTKLNSSFEDQSPLTYKNISSQTSEIFDPFLSIENQGNESDGTSLKTNENIYAEFMENNEISENFQETDTSPRNSSDSAIPGTSFESMTCQNSCFTKSDSEENGVKNDETKNRICEKPGSPRKKTCKTDKRSEIVSKHLKPPMDSVMKETRDCETFSEETSDHWAKKRKQFRETKNCNSAGASSMTSNITDESGNSEESRSADTGSRAETKDRGLYTESFHSAAWIFRGDDGGSDNSPRCLSKRPRSVAVRERTVRIAKGTGDYPWGFRIQFSKPILVTEVDTNGAAEEAGLLIGDIVMAVNGTDVTSIPHSEAATLARQGPDVLTLVVGSDISRLPNTPRPTCRGYLHKRTHSGLLKGWRKRWFVLKHDGTLHYYKHKKDEGKSRPLEVTNLEGSEIGVDTTLGKPFVFRCAPQSANRTYYFCATSNQEMKRWLDAMDKAIHPLNQNHVWVDVTMHNISLPPLAIKNPECLGLLQQLDKNKDVWVQHYCILKDGCLYFYSSIRSTSALGGIYLQGYTICEQSVNSKRCIIELRPPSEEFKTFYLSAGNAAENKRWITSLKISINKWLPLHQAIQDFMSRPLEETRM